MDKPEDSQRPKPPGEEPRTYMSPKLRTKMGIEDEPEESGSKAQNVIALVMLVAIVALGAFLYTSMQRSKAEAKVKAAEAAKATAAAALRDSLAKKQQDSLYAVQQDSIAKYTAKHPQPKTPPPTATAGGTPPAKGAPAAATPPPPASHFGIDVGTFLSQDRATSEQTKLQGSTGLSAKVEPVTEDGVTSYRVVLGEFPSKNDAEKKANALIVAQTIKEAHVVKLKAGS